MTFDLINKKPTTMEDIITIAIYIHAFFGGIGLTTGIGSTIVKKRKQTS